MSHRFRTIEEVCVLVTDGTHYSPPDIGKGIPFLTVKDMNGNGLDFEGSSKISEEEYKRALLGNSAPKNGDVLFSKDGTVGKVHVLKESRRFAVLSSIAILRPNTAILDSNYFGHILQMPQTLDQASRKKTGSALRRIILKDLKDVKIPLPSLPEQQRIAAILDKADALRAQRCATLAKLDTLLQATFLHLFGDPVTNPKGWEVVEFCQSPIQIIDGDRGKNYPKRDELLESGFCLFLNTKNVSERGFRFDSCQFISKDKDQALRKGKLNRYDVVLTTRGTVGNTAYYGDDIPFQHIRINSGMVILRTKDISLLPQFLEFYISSTGFKKQVEQLRSGTAQPQLPINTLKKVKIPLPPIEVQRKFIKYREFIEGIQILTRFSLDKLDNLFHSLQQRAFKGEL